MDINERSYCLFCNGECTYSKLLSMKIDLFSQDMDAPNKTGYAYTSDNPRYRVEVG